MRGWSIWVPAMHMGARLLILVIKISRDLVSPTRSVNDNRRVPGLECRLGCPVAGAHLRKGTIPSTGVRVLDGSLTCSRDQSVQVAMLNVSALDPMTRRKHSSFHSVYMPRVAIIARRCPSPLEPSRASFRSRQTHVARFRPSPSGMPNQYLGSIVSVVSQARWAARAPTSAVLHS